MRRRFRLEGLDRSLVKMLLARLPRLREGERDRILTGYDELIQVELCKHRRYQRVCRARAR